MPQPARPDLNLLLAGLSPAERERIFPQLELVDLQPGIALHEPREPLHYAYFPVDSIISLLCETRDGDTAEFSVVGSEGFFGVVLLLGFATSPRRAIVQCGGPTYRLARQALMAEFSRFGGMHDQFLRFVQGMLSQTAQIAACNRHHTVEQQFCRWLLFFHDRSRTGRVNMTHQRIAAMLGVRREGVTLAARKLQQLGAIAYHRGDISVLDRSLLEQVSCECYSVVKREMDRLTPGEPRGEPVDRPAVKTA